MKYLFLILILFIVFLLTVRVHAKNLHKEADYQQVWCEKMGGTAEYVLPGRARVDCVLDDYAVEFDFDYKWSEAIGQSLYYAEQTSRLPGIVLIMEDQEKGYKYLIRLLKGISMTTLKWRLWITTPDDLDINSKEDNGPLLTYNKLFYPTEKVFLFRIIKDYENTQIIENDLLFKM